MSRLWLTAIISVLGSACLANTATSTPGEPPDAVAASEALSASYDPCAVVRCRAGYECVSKGRLARCLPVTECTSTEECRLYSDYCNGCNCIALAAGEQPPVCHGAVVQCFVDPCRGAVALCEEGSCVAGNGATF